MQCVKRKIFNTDLDVFISKNRSWLIGVQMAQMLNRETFNLYRSLKLKNIETIRANPEEVDFLVSVRAVRSGTHSVTLIPLEEALYFIADVQNSKAPVLSQAPMRSFLLDRPRLHRRKPAPWDIRRSVKKGSILDPSRFVPLSSPFQKASHVTVSREQLTMARLALLYAAARQAAEETCPS